MDQSIPRLLRPLPEPLGLYFRPRSTDKSTIQALLAEGISSYHGFVFDPCLEKNQEEINET